MKKFIYFLFFVFFSSINFLSAQNDGDVLFDDTFLHEIRFENTDTNNYINTKNYQQLKMLVDGNVVDSVGFKRKGNISGYPSTNKFGIKIKTNKYVAGQEYDGTKEFTLHMNYQDPTMMREKLTYDLCSDMGLFSLRTAFAKVYINNVYWGLFTIVEGKDEMYKQVFNNRGMDAIESLDFGDMCFISNTPWDYDYLVSGWPRYQLEGGDSLTAWPNFSTMIDKANNSPSANYVDTLSKYLNIEDFLTYQAVNVYLMNFDSYLAFRGNQIFVYDTLTNIWQVTPWDFNASFGLWETSNQPNSYAMIPTAISGGCIASEINNHNQLKDYYLDAMCELTNSIGDTNNYFAKIDNFKNQIKQAVYDDTRKVVTNLDFDNGLEFGYNTLFGENQPALKTLVRERLLVVKQGLVNENYTCVSTIGIKEVIAEQSLSVFPNPASSIININYTNKIESNYTIKLVNALGQTLNNYSTKTTQLNIEDLPSGLYFIKVQNGNEVAIKKFIKQ